MPRVRTSAIVTCHNYGRFLASCLDSLLAQTEPFLEVILIDDGSTDETPQLWSARYRQKVLYRRIEKFLQMEARNEGVRTAGGDFLVHVDADDWLSPRYHELMIQPLLEDKNLGFTYCGMRYVGESGADLAHPYHDLTDFDPYRLWIANYLPQTCLVRKQAWLGDRRFYGLALPSGKALAEDWDLALETVKQGWDARLVPQKLIYKRLHGENISRALETDPLLLKTCRRRLRGSFFRHDLTVFLLIPPTESISNRCLENIRTIDLPPKTQVLAVDGSPAASLRNSLPDGWTHFSFPYLFRGTRDRWKLRALRAAARLISGKEILILDAEIRLPRDAYAKMTAGKAKKRADFYSASVPLPDGSVPCAIRAVNGDPERGLYFVPLGRGAKRVNSASLGACLADAHAFHEIYPRLNHFAADGKSPEWVFGQWSTAEKWRWFADGGIRAGRCETKPPTAENQSPTGAANSKDTPEVSIVIPVKDGAQTIGPLLESLAAVDYPASRLEIIVVDNGSRDGTAGIASRHPGVKVVKEPKPGSYAARNRGIRESRFDLIAFLDADLEVDKNWLRELIAPFALDPSVGGVAGSNRAYENHWLSRKIRACGGYMNLKGKPEYGIPPWAMTMNICYRKRVFEDIGPFAEDAFSGSDIEMSWRMQFLTAQKLILLENQAWVRHKDVRSLRVWFARTARIGRGIYKLHPKYPHTLPSFVYWLPQTRWEIGLQFVKGMLKARNTHAMFAAFNLFVLKWNYLKESKAGPKLLPEKDRQIMLVHGTTPLRPPVRKTYLRLWNRVTNSCSVVHLDPPRNLARSWYELALTILGGTTAWVWRPGLISLAEWRLFPRRFKKLRALEDRITARRIAKALRLARGASVRLLRTCCDSHVFTWRTAWHGRGIETEILSDPLELGAFYTESPADPLPVVRQTDVDPGGLSVQK